MVAAIFKKPVVKHTSLENQLYVMSQITLIGNPPPVVILNTNIKKIFFYSTGARKRLSQVVCWPKQNCVY